MRSETNRMWASASFVGVLIIIGLPLWWKTTEVYRVSLPYDKISALDSLSHTITTELTVLANDEPTAAEIADLLEKEFENSSVLKLKINKAVLSDKLHHTLNSVADEQEALEEVGEVIDLTKHNSLYVVQRKPLFEDVWVGKERVVFFRDATASTTVVQTLKRWIYQESILEGAQSDTPDAARRTRFPPGDGYQIILSVINPRPDQMKVEFNAAEAIEDYVGSFVDELSILHNFTLKSQWLYLPDFQFNKNRIPDDSEWGQYFAVKQEQLPQLLTTVESRAGTHVCSRPAINLALFIVSCAHAPRLIVGDDEKPVPTSVQAFMSPRWGGVMLSNPTPAECRDPEPVHVPNVRLAMGTFVKQLRELLGITDTEPIQGAHIDPLRSVAPRRWELDLLLRIRTLEQLTSAERTLQSLAQLLGEIPNIVINDEVGASINSAVTNIHQAIGYMTQGKLVDAYKTSQEAFLAAETAFMEPSLLALLYFPDDQKYAIYIPLFLPIMFPVVLSLKNLLLWFRGKPIHKDKLD